MSDANTSNRPKWLLELENRKRKPRLAHEAGAGAPCVICKTSCPGLDLHFWRKICKNCKCSKDDHDVNDEEFPQFDLLFGTSRKYKKRPILLHINGRKEHAEEAFEWVPPDTTKELAVDYMKALPTEKLPIKGSPGAALRRHLLQKQLPLHDIDHKICDELSDQERKQFEKYLENIKKYVGQGTVTKILTARPYDGSLMTPVNATDMQCFSPQKKPGQHANIVHLRTPSSFTPKGAYKKGLYEKANVQELPASSESGSSCSSTVNISPLNEHNTARSYDDILRLEQDATCFYNKGIHPVAASKTGNNDQNITKEILMTENIKSSNNAAVTNINSQSVEPYKKAYIDILRNPSINHLHSSSVDDDNVCAAEIMLANALLPPSTVHANDIIGSTLDDKGLRFIREKLTNKYSNQENACTQHSTRNFAKSLDTNNSPYRYSKETENTDIIPTGKNQSVMLIPSQDTIQMVERYTNEPELTETEMIKPDSQINQSDLTNSPKVVSPNELREHIPVVSSAITDTSFPLPTSSLQAYLQSPKTNNIQAKFNNFATPSTVIYSENIQNQIFPHEPITHIKKSEEQSPNSVNLKCAMQGLTIDTAKSHKCQKCSQDIRVGDVAVITEKAKNAVWHPGCFVCYMCNELLVDLVYFYYKSKLYCGRDLAALLEIPRCFACDELIFVREYTVAQGHNYHVKHFCCWSCDIPLAGKRYIVTENEHPLCLLCYQRSYAKTCNMCENVIAADQQGVAVKDLNFHATGECFCCYTCHKNLLNGRVAIKQKKIFCSKECISKFLNPRNL